jgi:hypothetical protein
MIPGDKFNHGQSQKRLSSTRPGVVTPSNAVVREIIGPAGSDMQIFRQQSLHSDLKDARKERQYSRRVAPQSNRIRFFHELIEFNNPASSSNLQSILTLEERATERLKIDECRVVTCGSEKSCVPPASQVKPFPISL